MHMRLASKWLSVTRCTVLCMFDVSAYGMVCGHTHTRYAIMLHRGKKDYPAAVRYGSHVWRCVTFILLC